ncbi:MAG: ATP-dependent Clp protease adaptor ClpS [Spirochaetia bacterium]|jgi:ATP-dependent Clp protease adaptor protein ClpS|uniref:ATP-dependent Clp protease adapter protein ClpS n=1 Tax=uncultured spirochete TaxID=156406 RepID=A0A3P3XM88_9SPIR|nr:ATP-dependent Clp protease adaptor ClpS [Rectinema subterraneum]MDQ7796399.1 ATP-dependent Clp protease adaptor ClpS [Spirochaetia bacterium]SLM15506.1 ATP-dependent Clp protease adapter protein ClpS (modular protein) [uncultured spirochete]HBE46895.1 ATP-dependent Clp protease adaptor ClpS [Spirochaetaceae bacterium]HCX96427.1 ATP-dependent Clp protease adaptor ClpS [Spirochaetaceae bacterium]
MGTRVTNATGTQELTQHDLETNEPEEYRVYLINDDFTTMEFVISILMTIFHKSLAEATKLTLEVHRKGRGMAGVFPYDIATTKIQQVHAMARQRGFPLRCIMEKA